MSLGFTSPESPLRLRPRRRRGCDRGVARRCPRQGVAHRVHDGVVRSGREGGCEGVHREDPRPAHARRGKPVHRDRPSTRATVRRGGVEQALCIGLLRDAPAEPACGTRLRLGHRHGRLDLGLRPGDGGRRAAERLPARPCRERPSATGTMPPTSRRCATSTRSTATSSRSTVPWSRLQRATGRASVRASRTRGSASNRDRRPSGSTC